MPSIDALEGHRSTAESGMCEKQRTQGTAAQACQPKGQWAAWPAGQNRMREDDSLIITTQHHLAYPGLLLDRQAERSRLIRSRPGQTLVNDLQREAPTGLDTCRQRSAGAQPGQKSDIVGRAQQLASPALRVRNRHSWKPR